MHFSNVGVIKLTATTLTIIHTERLTVLRSYKMSIFDDLRSKADANGDGKINKDDLEALRGHISDDQIDDLKKKADANGDGKVDASDLNDLKGQVSDMLNNMKGKFGN